MFKVRRVLGLLALLIGGMILAGCQATTKQSSKKLSVVTTTNFYGEMARAVGGKHVQVTSIINKPTVDPHDYEPTPQVAKQVAGADLAIANGLGYDGWMNKLVKSAGTTKLMRVGEDVLHRKAGVNEHLWYDVQTMPAAAKYLANQLGKIDLDHRAVYQKNAATYIDSLKPINKQVNQLKRQVAKLDNRNVFVSEPVFDLALKTIGLKVTNANFENAVEKGSDPSPKVVHQMQTALKRRQVILFVNNRQVSSSTVTNMVKLAKQNDVAVLGVTETMPANVTYQEWMLKQYRQLSQLLK